MSMVFTLCPHPRCSLQKKQHTNQTETVQHWLKPINSDDGLFAAKLLYRFLRFCIKIIFHVDNALCGSMSTREMQIVLVKIVHHVFK